MGALSARLSKFYDLSAIKIHGRIYMEGRVIRRQHILNRRSFSAFSEEMPLLSSPAKQATRPRGLFRTFFLASLSVFLLFLLLFAPQAGLTGARYGLALCAEIVIPTLFPFLAVSSFIIRIGLAERFGRLFSRFTAFVFRLPGASAAALALGVLGGYPVGAKACAELLKTGELDRSEGNRLLTFAVNSSPAYIIGAVGAGLLHSAKAGVLLYAAHVSASFLLGVLLGLRRGKKHSRLSSSQGSRPHAFLPAPDAFVGSVSGAAESMLGISAFVVFFSALSSLIFSTGLVDGLARLLARVPGLGGFDAKDAQTLLKGFLEVSGGCDAAVKNGAAVLIVLSAFLSWSGLSVVFQVLYTVRGSGLSARGYVLSRPLHMLFSILFTLLLFHFFPVAVPAMAEAVSFTPSMHNAPASAALLFTCAMLLLSRATV